MTTRLLVGAAAALAVAAVTRAALASRPAPLETVPAVDLARYTGRWFEIAKLPNRFERSCASDVQAEYTLNPDGTLGVVNSCRRADGRVVSRRATARVVDEATRARLSVTFFWPFSGDYWILALGPEEGPGPYEYALVGEPKRRFLWVLARERELPREVAERLLAQAAAQGFDVSKVTWMPQRAPAADATRRSKAE